MPEPIDYSAGRPNTPDRVRVEDGVTITTITAKRCCNGCGRELGDVNETEIDCALVGAPLPDVRVECGCLQIGTFTVADRTEAVYPAVTLEQFHGRDCGNGIYMIEFDNPVLVAYGHHYPAAFVAAGLVYYREECGLAEDETGLEIGEVRRVWALCIDPGDEWRVWWPDGVTAETPGAFPLTIWEA